MYYIGYMDESRRKNARGYKYFPKGFKTLEEAQKRKEEIKIDKPYLAYFISDGRLDRK